MAPLRYAAKFDPFLSLDCARVEGVGAQILPSGNLVSRTVAAAERPASPSDREEDKENLCDVILEFPSR